MFDKIHGVLFPKIDTKSNSQSRESSLKTETHQRQLHNAPYFFYISYNDTHLPVEADLKLQS